jgi:hypothetical protein
MGEHVIADGIFLVDETLDDAVVDALVVSTAIQFRSLDRRLFE